MGNSAIYKRNLFNPKSLFDLVMFSDCVVTGKTPYGDDIYLCFAEGMFIIKVDGKTQKLYSTTNSEEQAVKTFWDLECGESMVSGLVINK